MTRRYRPQPWWLLVGPLLGAFSGGVVATVWLASDVLGRTEEPGIAYIPADLADAATLGTVFGGLLGSATGLAVGAVLAVAVGRHLPAKVARRRSFVLGVVLPAPALYACVAAITGQLVVLGTAELRVLVAAGAMGGPLALLAAHLRPLRTRVS